jgi:NAD(P)-dependent dehydrogenase (short-subunit alcohol dehydrogenase family)
MNLKDVPAIVTGGASGLGEATARALAAAGARVTLFDMNGERAAMVAGEIGGRSAVVDVTDEAQVVAALDAAQAAHGIARVLVNCAGIGPAAKTTSRGQPHPIAMFRKVVEINLVGSFLCLSHFATRLAEAAPLEGTGERGVAINTASVAAYDGQVGQAAYAASKGGVVGMTLPVARDLADRAIRVMTIAPGLFETPMLMGLPEEVRISLGKQVPFPSRLGYPAEYAQLALAIIANPMLNGEVIRLDGAIRMAPR